MIAPANVLHGAVRLQGLTSSPTPETQVREACASAGAADRLIAAAVNIAKMAGRCIEAPMVSEAPTVAEYLLADDGARRLPLWQIATLSAAASAIWPWPASPRSCA